MCGISLLCWRKWYFDPPQMKSRTLSPQATWRKTIYRFRSDLLNLKNQAAHCYSKQLRTRLSSQLWRFTFMTNNAQTDNCTIATESEGLRLAADGYSPILQACSMMTIMLLVFGPNHSCADCCVQLQKKTTVILILMMCSTLPLAKLCSSDEKTPQLQLFFCSTGIDNFYGMQIEHWTHSGMTLDIKYQNRIGVD